MTKIETIKQTERMFSDRTAARIIQEHVLAKQGEPGSLADASPQAQSAVADTLKTVAIESVAANAQQVAAEQSRAVPLKAREAGGK